MKGPVLQRHSDYYRYSEADLARFWVLIDLKKYPLVVRHSKPTGPWIAHKIDLNILDRARPSIESENLVCKIDTLVGSNIMHSLASRTLSRR
jgi:hypothetical protein